MTDRNLYSRLGVWLHQPGKRRDSWPHGMGQAETDGPDRPGWRGDRWQHGTARKGGHMATWDWQEHKSLRWAQLQAWWVWICLGESKTAFTSFDSSSDTGWDPVDCRMRPWLCAVCSGQGCQPLHAAESFFLNVFSSVISASNKFSPFLHTLTFWFPLAHGSSEVEKDERQHVHHWDLMGWFNMLLCPLRHGRQANLSVHRLRKLIHKYQKYLNDKKA